MTRRPLVLALALSAAVAACSPADTTGPSAAPSAAQGRTTAPGTAAPAPILVVDDAAAANAELVESAITVPPGFDVPARTLRMPRGVRVAVLAAGLPSPRFMAFDPAGNLLVGTRERAVYRYLVSNGAIAPAAAPPAPLLTDLD